MKQTNKQIAQQLKNDIVKMSNRIINGRSSARSIKCAHNHITQAENMLKAKVFNKNTKGAKVRQAWYVDQLRGLTSEVYENAHLSVE